MAGIFAAEGAQLPVYAADQPIRAVMFENVSTALTIGEVPDYTAYLTGDALLHASILNEGWACTADTSVHASKSEGLPVPDEPTGVPYSYLIALKADPGWYFPDDVSVYYNGEPISSDAYSGVLTDESQILILNCGFIPQVTPLAPDVQALSAAYIFDAVLEYSAGETPRFTARPADPSLFEIVYERWVDDLNPMCFVTSSEQFNAEMGLTDANRLTVFEAGGQYHYDICISAKYGYIFADDAEVYVNGKPCTVYGHPADIIPVNDVCVMTVKVPQTTAPVVTTAKPVITTAKPTVTTAKPVTTTAKPTVTTAKPVTTTAKPAVTTAKPVTTTAKPVTTTVKPVTTAVKTTTVSVTTAELDPDLLYGDLNCDGRVSVSDAVLLMRHLAEDLNRTLPEKGLRAADIDRDGVLGMADAFLLLALLKQERQTSVPVIVPPKDAAISDGTDPDPSVLPDTSGFEWICDPGGDSDAFTEEVLGRVTVSADENALSYDGQLQFSELDDEEAKALDQRLAAYDTLMLDAWHIEAGLKPDEHLPGYYTCSYDLSALEIPAELYEQLSLLRIDDDGTITEYPIEIEGDTLSWMSDQNSVAVLVMIGKGLLVAIEIYLVANAPEYIQWLKAGDGCVGSFETDRFTIWYQDNEPQETKDARTKRLQEIEADATRKAREYAEEKVGDNWGPIAGLFMNYVTEVNKAAAKKKNELLADNTEYQDLMTLENGHPADVVLLARQYDIAMDYLYYQENCPRLKKPDIIFNPVLGNLGEASLNYIYKNYMLIMRTVQEDNAHIDKDTSYWDLYGTAVPSEVCDQLLTTLTHELYHLVQATKLFGKLESNTKFFEMSALTIECHAADYYMQEEHKYIQTHKLDEGKCFETYGYPMDQVSKSLTEQNHNLQTASGYSLSYFWRHVEKIQKKQIKGWDMILGYKKYGSISELVNHLFGFSESAALSKPENKNDVLNVYWAHYQKLKETEDAALESMKTMFTVKYQYTEDKKEWYPSQIITHRFSSEKTQSYSVVKAKDLACTCVGVSGATDRPWSLILERDADFGELQPEHQFLFTASDDKYSGTESRKGAVVSSQSAVLYYRELQGYSEGGKSGYTVHYIPSPDTPEVTVDEENETLTVKLQSDASTEGAAGMTDRFLLVCTVNGQETYTQKIAFDKRAEPVKLAFGTLHLSMNRKNKLQIAVCELIDEGTDAAGTKRGEVRTALSKPFETELGEANFPEIEQTFRAVVRYGTVGDIQDVQFKLDKEGNYELSFEGAAWSKNQDCGPDNMNPFIMEDSKSKGSMSGFTVKGNAQKNDEEVDPANWSAPVSSCSADKFTADNDYVDWDAGIYEFEPGSEEDRNFKRWVRETITTVNGSFAGNVIGTLTFRFDVEQNSYYIELQMSPTLTVKTQTEVTPGTNPAPGESGKSEKTMTENSIVLTGSFMVS